MKRTKPHLGFLSLTMFFFLLFCFLGQWQLHRYHLKTTLLARYHERIQATPRPLADLYHESDVQFQRVIVRGQFRNDQTFFIQNRFHQNKPGVEVITPFEVAGEKNVLLVDRGWMEKPFQAPFPTIPAATQHTVVGNVKTDKEYQFILGANILAPTEKPLVIQKIDLTELSQVLQQPLLPFVLHLDATAPGGFVREWTITTMTPERHLGYAVQWFLMALALAVVYGKFCLSREKS